MSNFCLKKCHWTPTHMPDKLAPRKKYSQASKRIILKQIKAHLSANHILSPLQSAKQPQHSPKTAFLKITNDLLCAAGKGDVSAVALFDLSAALDGLSITLNLSPDLKTLSVSIALHYLYFICTSQTISKLSLSISPI